jgi:serine acetyltransferase
MGYFWNIIYIPIALLKFSERYISKSHISIDSEIDGYIFLPEEGNILFGPTKAGNGSVIGTRVTIGMNHIDGGRPTIGRNVWIGSDCVIYGNITLGDGSTLLPGCVLTKSIPENVIMQGNPARLIFKNFDNTNLRELKDIDAIQYLKKIVE